jgi:dolichol kinase
LFQQILTEGPYAILVGATVIAGLWISNVAYDRGVPHYISRKIGHIAGGLAFLTGVLLFSSAWWPMLLALLFSALLIAARLMRPQTFRGVGGSARIGTLSEVWFALVAVPVFAVAWLWLRQPFVALASLLFMAWGDCVTGVVRARVYHRPVKGLWGSFGMLLTCLVIAGFLVRPFWIGAIGAIAATATEWSFGEYGLIRRADDNWAIPISSIAVILGIMWLTGNL